MNPFGLISQLAQTRIALPLIHVETRFRVTGEFAAVEMDQVFEQTAREPLDVTYTFPLPGAAAVYRCEMIVNERIIRARVMEEQEARRTVAEKKAAGHRTALVEMDRESLFTLQLGNTAPGDRIVIRFAYFEKLDRLGSSDLSLRIPFCPGIRYIPGKPLLRKNRGLGSVDDTDQVPDASRLSPPRIGADHPDAATLYLHGALDADEVALRTLSSPSHPALIRPAEALLEVELAGEQHVPDRDFILRWQETAAAAAKPKAWVSLHRDPASGSDHRYALLQVRAPQLEAVAAAADDFAQDIYFLLDRSGSMAGGNREQATLALHAFVRQLGARDRVWLTCFESHYQDFSDVPMPRNEILADPGFQNLAAIGADGGTELLPALRHVLAKRSAFSPQRPARLILITDGQVGNEAEIYGLCASPSNPGYPCTASASTAR
jgi:Ca-activated chloride channel family protein